MCLTPVSIKNVNRNILSQNNDFSLYTDVDDDYILVPCGHCPVCVALKQQYLVQRVQMESLDNVILYGMLSYNSQTLPSININGYNIKYADVRHFQDMIRYIRSWEVNVPHFSYFAQSEFGGRKHRPHWHFMIFIPKTSIVDNPDRLNSWHLDAVQGQYWPIFLKYWRHNVGSRKHPVWIQNLTYNQRGYKRNYDLQVIDTISRDCADSAFYITKYSTKASDYVDRLKSALFFNLSESEFREKWDIVKPKRLMSKGFGNPTSANVVSHIRKGIEFALKDEDCFYPVFFSPYSGASFPLCPYFRKKFLSFDEELIFKKRILSHSPTGLIGDAELGEKLTPYEIEQRYIRFEKTKKMIDARDGYFSDGTDFLGSDNHNLFNFLSTDVNYGKSFKLSQEDFDPSDDWEDSFGHSYHDSDCCDSLF